MFKNVPPVVRKYFIDVFNDIFSIKLGTDVDGTIDMIKSGVKIRGANGWILICGAMLASIGLDTNSSAIIIGAMLISPLMSPILGIGLGIGISDWSLLWSSIKNFSIAVGISLLTATIYFSLTPLGIPTMEMAARTKPTLLDVGVAIFGGVAGIVANSRREKTNAIPGVAIATALMPPLCTSGFGLATGDIEYFLGAFYLFFINAVFISLSTYVIVRFLGFPTMEYVDDIRKRRMQKYIAVFSFIVIIPSGVIFWEVISEAKTDRNVKSFVNEVVNQDDREAINWLIEETDSTSFLKLYIVGDSFNQRIVNDINKERENYGIDDFELKFVQMNVNKEDKDELMSDISVNIMKQMEMKQLDILKARNESDEIIDSLQTVITNVSVDPVLMRKIKNETKEIFPEIASFSYGLMTSVTDTNMFSLIPATNIIFSEEAQKRDVRDDIKNKFMNYLKARLERDTMVVY